MKKIVQVASDEALLSLDAIYGLATFLETLHLPRRKVLDWLADTIFGWIDMGGVILDGQGREITVEPDTIDDAHGLDGSGKWVSDIRNRTSKLPRRRARRSILRRLQLYDAAVRIKTQRSIVDFGKEEGDGHEREGKPAGQA